MTFRIDVEAKKELAAFAKSRKISVSSLLLANVRHMLREGDVGFPIKHEEIPMSKIERDARRRRARDGADIADFSKLDVYDG